MLQSRTTANFEPSRRVAKVLREDASESGTGHVRKELDRWLQLYRGFLRRRFDQASAGNGEFEPLAPATVAAKEKRTKSRRRGAGGQFIPMGVYILRESDTLYNALAASPGGGPGWTERHVRFGVEAGYGGAVAHPNSDTGLSIADLARIHYDGGPRLPSRKIVVTPDEATQDDMTDGLGRAIGRIIKEAGAA